MMTFWTTFSLFRSITIFLVLLDHHLLLLLLQEEIHPLYLTSMKEFLPSDLLMTSQPLDLSLDLDQDLREIETTTEMKSPTKYFHPHLNQEISKPKIEEISSLKIEEINSLKVEEISSLKIEEISFSKIETSYSKTEEISNLRAEELSLKRSSLRFNCQKVEHQAEDKRTSETERLNLKIETF